MSILKKYRNFHANKMNSVSTVTFLNEFSSFPSRGLCERHARCEYSDKNLTLTFRNDDFVRPSFFLCCCCLLYEVKLLFMNGL